MLYQMKEGPSKPGLQEQASNSHKLLSSNDGGDERYGKGVSKLRHVWVRETNASEPLMRPRNRSTDGIKTGAPPLSGKSMAETWLLAMRCPGYRWRDSLALALVPVFRSSGVWKRSFLTIHIANVPGLCL
jgi:hypothetical protein